MSESIHLVGEGQILYGRYSEAPLLVQTAPLTKRILPFLREKAVLGLPQGKEISVKLNHSEVPELLLQNGNESHLLTRRIYVGTSGDVSVSYFLREGSLDQDSKLRFSEDRGIHDFVYSTFPPKVLGGLIRDAQEQSELLAFVFEHPKRVPKYENLPIEIYSPVDVIDAKTKTKVRVTQEGLDARLEKRDGKGLVMTTIPTLEASNLLTLRIAGPLEDVFDLKDLQLVDELNEKNHREYLLLGNRGLIAPSIFESFMYGYPAYEIGMDMTGEIHTAKRVITKSRFSL